MAKYLIVIDMQNDFITGPLGTPEAVAIVNKIKNKIIKEYPVHSFIFFTRDTHYSNYFNSQEGKNLPIKHCINETPGWCIVDELNHFSESNRIINKITFGTLNWTDTFLFKDCNTIEIVGVCTDICVISNALILKAIFPETRIIVDSSCCAGTTPELHQKALDVMRSCQIEII